MDQMKDLHDWYIHLLSDLHDAENQVLGALPKMQEAASTGKLKNAFKKHLTETRKQVERLDKIFQEMGEKPSGEKCKGMEGLIKEGQDLLRNQGKIDKDVLDAGLIVAAQKVEHYEIASYGTARSYAELMGHRKAARSLQATLDEEGKTNEKLTELAEGSVNRHAQAAEKARSKGRRRSSAKSGAKSRSKAPVKARV